MRKMRKREIGWIALSVTGLLAVVALAQRSGRAGQPGRNDLDSAQRPPLAKTEAEKRILSVLDDMDRNQRHGMMNVPVADGRLLRVLTESIGAKHVVEIGTSNGYSGIWLCLALRTTGGKLTTYEIDARRAALARQNFKRAGLDEIVTLIEADAHEEVTKIKEPIDLLFLDADKSGYIDYLNKLLPLVRPGGLIVAHNMNRPRPDPAYIRAITTNPDLETVFLNMHAAGVGVTLKKR
ncbi:MAG: O-methyltransferase [Phycisphaerae bacterium]